MNPNAKNDTAITPLSRFLVLENDEALFTRWHIPKAEIRSACIICPPLGHEYKESH